VTTRRTVVRGVGAGALLVGEGRARRQPQARIPRIGMLVLGDAEDAYSKRAIAVLRQRLAELGYVDGETVLIDARYADGNGQRLTELAREPAASKVDVIVAVSAAATGRQCYRDHESAARRQACRLDSRTRHQPQNRQGTWSDDPAIVAAARR